MSDDSEQEKLWAMKFIVCLIRFLTRHRTCVSFWAALSHGWHARGEIREKLSAKMLRRTQGFGKYEKLRHLVDGKLSFCSSLLQIRDENFSPGISLRSYFTTSHVCSNLEAWKSFLQEDILCIWEKCSNFSIFHMIKMSKRFHDWPETGWSLKMRKLRTNIYFLII